MALIKCKECGNDVSTDAATCPRCGANMRKTRPVFKVLGYILCFLFVLVLFFPEKDKEVTGAENVVQNVSQSTQVAPTKTVERSFEGYARSILNKDEIILKITERKDGKHVLHIKYAPDHMWSSSSLINSVSRRLIDIGKDAKKNSLSLGSLVIDIWVPVEDKYANSNKRDALTIAIPGEEMEKINWENISGWKVLNLSSFKYNSNFGREIHQEYCLEKDSLRYAGVFCSKVGSDGGSLSSEENNNKPSANDIKAYDQGVQALNSSSAEGAYAAEVEINQVWKQLSKEKRQELLPEQREFNRMKEEKCLKPFLEQGAGSDLELAKNMCLYETYKKRTQELRRILEQEQQ